MYLPNWKTTSHHTANYHIHSPNLPLNSLPPYPFKRTSADQIPHRARNLVLRASLTPILRTEIASKNTRAAWQWAMHACMCVAFDPTPPPPLIYRYARNETRFPRRTRCFDCNGRGLLVMSAFFGIPKGDFVRVVGRLFCFWPLVCFYLFRFHLF